MTRYGSLTVAAPACALLLFLWVPGTPVLAASAQTPLPGVHSSLMPADGRADSAARIGKRDAGGFVIPNCTTVAPPPGDMCWDAKGGYALHRVPL